MSAEDFKQYINSSHDFYDLLGVNPETPPAGLKSAYRKAALKYHPDKAGTTPEAVEKFQLVQIADALFADAAAKAAYDNARAAQLQKKRQRDQYDAKQREMIERLERGERNNKRKADGTLVGQELSAYDKEIARCQEETKKQRERFIQKRRLQQEQEAAASTAASAQADNGELVHDLKTEVEDSTVRVRWKHEEGDEAAVAGRLAQLFSTFGEVERAVIAKKSSSKPWSALVMYRSSTEARKAMEEYGAQKGPYWNKVVSVAPMSSRNKTNEASNPAITSPAASISNTDKNGTRKSAQEAQDDIFARLREASRKKKAAAAKAAQEDQESVRE